ncbi:ComF family protein [Aestuariibius sp. HNIBRBA575]|uniref:ComF family protein n=1 Tax=Aestuariibius sp. HNIBRBA575 TaxID=3233343 RepID=UPI0034A569F1
MALQSVIRAIYPAQCLICDTLTEEDFALCGSCWAQTPFVTGLVCDACGTPLPGEEEDSEVLCDECMQIARPWHKGRTAMLYQDKGRHLTLALKHGDRTDLSGPMGVWMARVAGPLLSDDMIVAPVPLHWTRLFRRRYNQAALLAQSVARQLNLPCRPDALIRVKRTQKMEKFSRDARFAALDGAISNNPKASIANKSVLLVDDVMTTGATLAACCEALHHAGVTQVCTLTLARAAKDT